MMNRKEAKLIRVCADIQKVKVANVDYNVEQIIKLVDKAYKQDVDVIVFPELCVTGYTCGDLFHQETLIEAADK